MDWGEGSKEGAAILPGSRLYICIEVYIHDRIYAWQRICPGSSSGQLPCSSREHHKARPVRGRA